MCWSALHGTARRIGVLIQEVKLLFQHKDRHDNFTTLLPFLSVFRNVHMTQPYPRQELLLFLGFGGFARCAKRV